MKKLLLFLAFAMIIMAVISGCSGFNTPSGSSHSGSLVLNISESGVKSKTIEPNLNMTIATYDIIGTGPNGANFRKDNVTSGSSVTINTLAVGNWTIEADAKNNGGTLIASGITTVSVTAGTTVNASITVRPINGTGILNITVSWPAGIITNPSVTGTLIPVSGTVQNISFTLAGDHLSATYQNNAITTGYYTLITQLKDGSTLKWSAVDAVRIINGQTSTGTYALTAVQSQFGDIQLVINPDLQNPIAITLSGQQDILTVGTDMTVTVTPSQTVDSYQWYLNGTPLPGATNASLTIGKSLGIGNYLLAVVVTKGNIVSSKSFGFSIASPTPTPTPTPVPVIYVATWGGGISISTNRGVSFSTYTTANGLGCNVTSDILVSDSIIYVATWGGGLSISTNGGASFTNRTTANGLGSNNIRTIYVSSSTIYACTDNGVSISTNGGLSFTNYTTANGLGNNNVYHVNLSDSVIYAGTYGGGLSVSTNGGLSFTNYTTTNGLGSNYVYRGCASGSTIYAATLNGLSISTNGGISFTNYTTANGLGSNNVGNIFVTGSTIYAATWGGGLSISTNDGVSFTNYRTTNGLISNDVHCIYVLGSTIYISTLNGLSITTNNCASFTNITTANGLGNNDVRSVFVL